MILTAIGIASGIVTLLVFLTGKPSILHFLPLKGQPLKHMFPSPFVKWRFIVKSKVLFLRHEYLEIAMLTDLDEIKDYRIIYSADHSKFLIISKLKAYQAYHYPRDNFFQFIVIANADGSKRKVHSYSSGIINAEWFSNDTYLIYLEHDKYEKYPDFWRHLPSGSIGLQNWEYYVISGNYLVQLNSDNEIIKISNY